MNCFPFCPQQYLIPQAMASSGIQKDQLVISKEAINALIKWYCRESGVRNLQKHIEKVCVCVYVFACICL